MAQDSCCGDRLVNATLVATNLSKWFGEVVAVNKLEVEIGTGVTGLLGPNGAGKSTFIKLATGLLRPSQGSVTLLGERVWNNYPVLSKVGYCPEADKLYDDMTGFEFVSWMARYSGLGRRAVKPAAEKAIELLSMTHRMHDRIPTYSRGMRQRIKLAQAIVHDPQVIFLDEPMAGLDPEGREDMFSLIREMGEQGRTVIVSSHILYEIERVTNNVILLNRGCVLARGNVHDIRELIDEHPHTISIHCNAPRLVASHFVSQDDVLSVEFESEDGGVTIQTRRPNKFYPQLAELITSGRIDIQRIECPDDNLQSVFEYLVK